MIEKYGKSLKDIFDIKKDFFSDNEKILNDLDNITRKYSKQPKRTNCKICNSHITSSEYDFNSHGINYLLCPECGHLNGEYLETYDFLNSIYTDDNYLANYTNEDRESYITRANNIYLPKARFLQESTHACARVLDVGAGAGYFVYALDTLGFYVNGIEVSKGGVHFGNSMIGKDLLRCVNQGEVINELRSSSSSIISMIGVLEHVLSPNEYMEAISNNPNVKFLFILVPLFSLSVFLEITNQNCMNRHLGGAHTHLFTDKSLEWITKKYGFKQIAKWQFGVDIMDMYRMIQNNLKTHGTSQKAIDYFHYEFLKIMDDMQLVVDKNRFSSEVHIIYTK